MSRHVATRNPRSGGRRKGPSAVGLPRIAIVGRPNVGKSSLVNALARQRVSIVEPTAGTTRDRVVTVCELADTWVELVDTGGHGVVDRDDLGDDVERQIRYAVDQATRILFVVDGREGLTPLDRSTAEMLRPVADRVALVANKVDEPHMGVELGEFVRLGFGEPLAVSAHSALGLRELREFIARSLAGTGENAPPDRVMKVALVGRRNAGKSTFVNALAGEERVIVSEIPGTTRDSIDVRIEKDGRALIIIDTAGMRKKAKIEDGIEFFAYSRALQSIRRSDVVLLMIDAASTVGAVDKRLAQLIAEEYKPCILVVNKWDLAKGRAGSDEYGEYLNKSLPEIDYAPISFTTANLGRNVDSTVDLASELLKQSRVRISTGQLNQSLREAIAESGPGSGRGRRRPKFFYATQASVEPPTIVVFVNDPDLVTQSYRRFLLNRMRERLPFDEVPIRLVLRGRREAAVDA